MGNKKIALVQLTSVADVDLNIEKSLQFLDHAIDAGADLVAFPECFLFLGPDSQYKEIAQSLDGSWVTTFRERAKANSISILLGSLPEIDITHTDKIFNTSVLINSDGSIAGAYRKIHLFDVELPNLQLLESETVSQGKDITVIDHPMGCMGLSICYDLRFPGLYQQLRSAGADIIFIPAAFTYQTGAAHWLTLLKARAIENQVYIVAPGQFGRHNSKRHSFGHSVIIDPWGEIVVQAPDQEGVILGEIDFQKLQQIRSEMPVFSHKVKGIDSF
ncbi:MAG: carbon-nitrogen hydrolase family protein [Proteobacteria bacterium]|nr:carbon-nitrogen hydrolase family protein [Pseudomonadota bacterium]